LEPQALAQRHCYFGGGTAMALLHGEYRDLAMQRADRELLQAACAKAEGAYGNSVRRSLAKAIEALQTRHARLEQCMRALGITTVTKAQLWQAIRKVGRALPEV
jgi:hypothetical protein